MVYFRVAVGDGTRMVAVIVGEGVAIGVCFGAGVDVAVGIDVSTILVGVTLEVPPGFSASAVGGGSSIAVSVS